MSEKVTVELSDRDLKEMSLYGEHLQRGTGRRTPYTQEEAAKSLPAWGLELARNERSRRTGRR